MSDKWLNLIWPFWVHSETNIAFGDDLPPIREIIILCCLERDAEDQWMWLGSLDSEFSEI